MIDDDEYFKKALKKAAGCADDFIKDMHLRRAQERIRREQNSEGGRVIDGECEVINSSHLGEP